MLTLPDRLVGIHRSLANKRIQHAFGGAIALAYWTLDPRGTSDIDVNIFVPTEDCERALATLPDGVVVTDDLAEQIKREGQARLWWDQTPVDVFFDNVPIHEQAKANRKIVSFAGTRIPILGPVELAVFKVMFDRTRDWADIEAMIAAGTLDVGAVRDCLSEMLGRADHRFERLDEAVNRALRAAEHD